MVNLAYGSISNGEYALNGWATNHTLLRLWTIIKKELDDD